MTNVAKFSLLLNWIHNYFVHIWAQSLGQGGGADGSYGKWCGIKKEISICVFIKLLLNTWWVVKFNNNEESLATLEVHTRRSKLRPFRDTLLFTRTDSDLSSTEVLVRYCTRPSQSQCVWHGVRYLCLVGALWRVLVESHILSLAETPRHDRCQTLLPAVTHVQLHTQLCKH